MKLVEFCENKFEELNSNKWKIGSFLEQKKWIKGERNNLTTILNREKNLEKKDFSLHISRGKNPRKKKKKNKKQRFSSKSVRSNIKKFQLSLKPGSIITNSNIHDSVSTQSHHGKKEFISATFFLSERFKKKNHNVYNKSFPALGFAERKRKQSENCEAKFSSSKKVENCSKKLISKQSGEVGVIINQEKSTNMLTMNSESDMKSSESILKNNSVNRKEEKKKKNTNFRTNLFNFKKQYCFGKKKARAVSSVKTHRGIFHKKLKDSLDWVNLDKKRAKNKKLNPKKTQRIDFEKKNWRILLESNKHKHPSSKFS